MEPGEETDWNGLYLATDTPWDIGYASPPLTEYANTLADKNLRILIPGCGNAYEASYLLENGFTSVTLIDISTVLADRLRNRLANHQQHVKVVTGDFFELVDQFDLIVEQTFFCALHPSLRRAYAKKMSELLVPNGKLAGVLFNREFTGGPPYGGNAEEYRDLFGTLFTIKTLEPCYNSIKPRMGSELFFELVKRS